MSERLVRAACPHDCPDTCAMLVTVDETGRATHVAGAPEHPITASFLCGKVSTYSDRVYSGERLLQPLLRTGPKGEGRFREATLDPPPFFDPPAEVTDPALAARFPLCLITSKTHLFLNSTFANGERQAAAQPSPYVVVHPDGAASRGIAGGAPVRVCNDRGSFVADAIISDDVRQGVAVAPIGWWNRSWRGGRSCQATTPQLLTRLRPAPTFNDNRVQIEAFVRR